jgi:hypothetical protein
MQWRALLWLTVYAVAMAQVEAAVVMHLRTIYYGANPLELFPLAVFSTRDLSIELVREAATVIMIASVAWFAPMGVFAAFIYVFGVWDVAYVWLKILLGWPTHWLGWDVLFLIPWPWLGPWIAPVLVALFRRCGRASVSVRSVSGVPHCVRCRHGAHLTAFLLPVYGSRRQRRRPLAPAISPGASSSDPAPWQQVSASSAIAGPRRQLGPW